ncbi:MAG: SDR family oxidoreductase, partial [Myxococcota bacterium]
ELPELDAATLGALETLGDVAQHLKESMGAPPAPPPQATATPIANPLPTPTAPSGVAGAELDAKLRAVVAEATGYPEDVLQPDMALEADLGIDSIKRVEILSMVKKAVPELPELDAATLGALETLGDVAQHLKESMGAPPAPPPQATATPAAKAVPQATAAPAAAPSPAPTAPSSVGGEELDAKLRAVVAEATGYPEDVLQPDMALEADLGIDSIKRVEILSMVKKVVPELPELDAATLGALETLGDVAQQLKESLQGESHDGEGLPALDASPGAGPPGHEHRFVATIVPAPATGLARVRPGSLTSIAVTGATPAHRAAVATALVTRGYPARATDRVEAADDGVILLHGLAEVRSAREATNVLRSAFQTLRGAPRVLSGGPALIVSVQATGGRFALEAPPTLERAPLAGLAALIKTAALEAPEAIAFAMDLPDTHRDPQQVAARLIGELESGGLEKEVGFDGRQRLSVAAIPSATTAVREFPLASGDVVVASGGARGVTAGCLLEMARQTPLRFVLLGRTPLEAEPPEAASATTEGELKRALLEASRARGEAPNPALIGRTTRRILASREIQGTLAALAAAGSEATYVPVDVTDANGLATALGQVRSSWGPISALIHAAGVIQDKRILDKTDAQFDMVAGTKIDGFLALQEVTAQDPLKACLLFSSVAAFAGNVGQVDYAMANAALDAFASILCLSPLPLASSSHHHSDLLPR